MADNTPTDQGPTQPDYSKTKDVERYFETGQVDLTSKNTDYEILKLTGGKSVVIKALVGNSGMVYIGRRNLDSSTGFELAAGESVRIDYFNDKDPGEFIRIYGLAASAGDDVCYMVIP